MNRTKNGMIIDALQLSHWDRGYINLLKKGGVTCVHASCGLWENARETLSTIGKWHQFFLDHEDVLLPVKKAEDILEAKRKGKIGVILGLQNTSALEDELALVSVFNELGIKIMQLTYNTQNLVGSSCYEEKDSGLSRYGKYVVEEMNRVGMIIDLSHVGNQTTLDAIAVSRRPVAITHANPDWIYPVKRNKPKEVLEALRENGGMIGICAYPHLVNGHETSLEEFCDMIVQTADFLGIDKVGIGTDMTYNMSEDFLTWMRMGRWSHEMDYGAGSKENPSWPVWPKWFQTPADYPNIAKGLAEQGLSHEDVFAIMGGNWFEFFEKGFEPEKGNIV